eukprot:g11506.t1
MGSGSCQRNMGLVGNFGQNCNLTGLVGMRWSLRNVPWLSLLFEDAGLRQLCLVGFLVNCQPSEPYLTSYLLEVKGLTEVQLDNQVWPWDTYSAFLFLLPAGLLAESLGYKTVVLIGLLARQATRIILIWGQGVFWMASMQVTYAAATSALPIFYAYAFMMLVDADRFQQASSHVHAFYHLGNVLGSLLGQAMVSGGLKNLTVLFYLSWLFSSAGLLVGLFLPPAKRDAPPSLVSAVREHGCRSLRDELGHLYRSRPVFLWTLWWLLGLATYSIIVNYFQVFIYDRSPNAAFGLMEALMELAMSIGAWLPLMFEHWLAKHSGPFIAVTALGLAACLLGAVSIPGLAWPFVLNVLALTVAGAQEAGAGAVVALELSRLKSNRFAVIFALNSFGSLGVASIIQEVLVSKGAPTEQYYITCGVVNVALSLLVALAMCGYKFCAPPLARVDHAPPTPAEVATKDGASLLADDEAGPSSDQEFDDTDFASEPVETETR